MEVVRSLMRLERYAVDTLHFATNSNSMETSEMEFRLVPSFTRKIRKVTDHVFDLGLSVNFETEEKNPLPFDIEVSVRGRFILESIDDEEKHIKTSGVAILFPYLRSTLSMLMSLASIPPITLPTINVAAMFEKEENEDTEKLQAQR